MLLFLGIYSGLNSLFGDCFFASNSDFITKIKIEDHKKYGKIRYELVDSQNFRANNRTEIEHKDIK